MRRACQGLAALLAVTFILFGWPLLLWEAATGPLSEYLPDLSHVAFAVTHPDATGLLLALVLLAAGAAWTVTAGALVIELVAQARGMTAPRLGGVALGGLIPQVSMSRLAATALFIVPMSGNLAGSPAMAADLAPAAVPASTAISVSAEHASAECGTAEGTKALRYTVRPGDTLWSVAEQQLGDGARYPEVFRASSHLAQPDGGRLRDPDLIRPGWQLEVPAARAMRAPRDCGEREEREAAGPRSAPPRAIAPGTQAEKAETPTTRSPESAAARAQAPQAPPLERGRIPGSITPAPTVDRLPKQSPAATTAPRPSASGSSSIDRGNRPTPSQELASPKARVVAAGSDHAELAWAAVPGASGYWVSVNDQSMQVPGTVIALRGLSAGSHYRVEVRSLFPSGQWSAPTEVDVKTATEPAGRAHPSASPATLRALRHPSFTGRSIAPPHAATSNAACPASHCLSRMRASLGIPETATGRAQTAGSPGPQTGHQPYRAPVHRRAQLPVMAATLADLRPPSMDRGSLIDHATQMSSSWLPGSAAQFITSGVTSVRT